MIVHLTGPLRDLFSGNVLELDLISDTDDLYKKIYDLNRESERIPFKIAVNGNIAQQSTKLRDADEVTLVTLFHGG